MNEFKHVISLIQNNFKDYLNINYLYQDPLQKFMYTNVKYNVTFNHDFDQYNSLSSQISNVEKKYKRRINRFYDNIQEPTLFIREISGSRDLKYIEKNIIYINNVFKKFNNDNKIIFVSRRNLESKEFKLYKVNTKINWELKQTFFKTNEEFYNYLDKEINYPKDKRKSNKNLIRRKFPERLYKRLTYWPEVVFRKTIGKYIESSKGDYTHYNQQKYLKNFNKTPEL